MSSEIFVNQQYLQKVQKSHIERFARHWQGTSVFQRTIYLFVSKKAAVSFLIKSSSINNSCSRWLGLATSRHMLGNQMTLQGCLLLCLIWTKMTFELGFLATLVLEMTSKIVSVFVVSSALFTRKRHAYNICNSLQNC